MGDDSFEEGIAALRREFAERLADRVVRLTAARDAWEAADAVADRHQALREMEGLAHQLSGSGALFGFPEIGAAAQALEAACQAGRDESAWPPPGPAIERTFAQLVAAADAG